MAAPGPPVAADAPLTSDKDSPAAPNIGTAFLLRFRFETCFACDMVKSLPYLPANIRSIDGTNDANVVLAYAPGNCKEN
jgi:hypothetical protein